MVTLIIVVAKESIDIATQTMLLGMEGYILRREAEMLQCGNCIATI
jgi:hypothetical protein